MGNTKSDAAVVFSDQSEGLHAEAAVTPQSSRDIHFTFVNLAESTVCSFGRGGGGDLMSRFPPMIF